MIEILNTIPEHLSELRENLRAEDRKELACFGISDRDALFRSWENSVICKTATVDGKVAGIWGVIGCVWEGVGCPWLLTAPICEQYPLQFALLYRQELREILKIFPVLENFVDASYHKSIKILEIMGFNLYNPEQYGPKGGLFRKFQKVA
jgi:hypothetical protein